MKGAGGSSVLVTLLIFLYYIFIYKGILALLIFISKSDEDCIRLFLLGWEIILKEISKASF